MKMWKSNEDVETAIYIQQTEIKFGLYKGENP